MTGTQNEVYDGNKFKHWKFSDLAVDLNYFFSHPNPNLNPTHLTKHESLNPNHQFSQRVWYVEYYSVHAYMAWSQKFRKSEISLDTGNHQLSRETLASAARSRPSKNLARSSLGLFCVGFMQKEPFSCWRDLFCLRSVFNKTIQRYVWLVIWMVDLHCKDFSNRLTKSKLPLLLHLSWSRGNYWGNQKSIKSKFFCFLKVHETSTN